MPVALPANVRANRSDAGHYPVEPLWRRLASVSDTSGINEALVRRTVVGCSPISVGGPDIRPKIKTRSQSDMGKLPGLTGQKQALFSFSRYLESKSPILT